MMPKAAVLAGLVLATALSGCFGGQPQQQARDVNQTDTIDDTQRSRLAILAAPEFRNYTLPGSARLAPVEVYFNDTLSSEANTAYQDRNMRGGMDYGTVLQTYDISAMVPAGQPTALRLTLSYFGQLGSSAKAHIYVCVPGTCTYYTTNNNDEFNWKVTVETKSVVTIGAPGEQALVGVAAANGRMASPLAFSLKVEASYFADVLTPFHAYAFTVPDGATGVTLRSVKPGQEHLQAKFVVLDPQDNLVSYVEYDDIAIPSESVFIPTRAPGEYVFYAQEMNNGFFSIESDAPLGNSTALRALATQLVETVDSAGGPLAPGMVERDWLGGTTISDPVVGAVPPVSVPPTVTPYSEGTVVSFTLDTFPLEVGAFIRGDGVTGAVEIRILSSKGEVYRLQRVARVDSGDGSLGYTRDEGNTMATWANLASGAHQVSIVLNGETGEIGHWVRTFQR